MRKQGGEGDQVIAAIDIKDAFLMAPQEEPLTVDLPKDVHVGSGERYKVVRVLPGQRNGTQRWYKFIRSVLEKHWNFKACAASPNIFRNERATLILHVDDLLVIGKKGWMLKFREETRSCF